MHLVLGSCIAAETAATGYACAYILGVNGAGRIFFGIWVLLSAALFFWRKFTPVWKLTVMLLLPVCVAAGGFAAYESWKSFSANAAYADVDLGKEKMFAGQKAMLIVPHQDDDINVLGGVMEEYVKYGSELYVVFVTNGDAYNIGQTRMEEAVRVGAFIGIPEENVIFLGYGDQWADGPHIYNAEPGALMTSHVGYTQTYGTPDHPAYHDGRSYTIDHLLEDMEAVILEYRPDVIFCSDYDAHIDHKAVSMLFEKAMGTILKEKDGYYPVVFKGFAYNTAWYGRRDFYADNILSTGNLFQESAVWQIENYRWEDRVRLPVKASALSRSLFSSEIFQSLAIYESQFASERAEGIINGDRVFWERDTTSVCSRAQITVSSGSGSCLNDFMLLENRELTDSGHLPYDGVWIPEENDSEKCAEVILEERSDLYSIVLYDHPSSEQNVLRAEITFDDGMVVETDALCRTGAGTEVVVNKENVGSFSVRLIDTEGDQAGLTEIEAFCNPRDGGGKLIKLMDAEGNFVYDYLIPSCGCVEFDVYAYGNVPELDAAQYSVSCSDEACTAVLENGKVIVNCPVGEKTVLTISCEAEGISDSVYIRNPALLSRLWTKIHRKGEQLLRTRYQEITGADI